jgi:hypothetical protein
MPLLYHTLADPGLSAPYKCCRQHVEPKNGTRALSQMGIRALGRDSAT